MDILIGLIPAVSWGVLPLAVSKLGGKPINQIFGTTLGALLVALIVQAVSGQSASGTVFLFCFISGAFWAFGQMLQYTAYTEIGVSKAMPLSTGMQLLGTSLLGVIAFGEWGSAQSKLIGFGSVAIVIVGVIITSYQENKKKNDNANMKKAVIVLLVSAVGYVGYSGFPRFVSANGWVEFLPQAVGMFSASVIFSIFMTRGSALGQKASYKNILPGLVFSIGALTFLLSTARNGVAVGFTLSQMNVVIATLGSIFLLGEKKTKKEMKAVLGGLALVVTGGVLINLAGT